MLAVSLSNIHWLFFRFVAVEEMRNGTAPDMAAKKAINRIQKYYPSFFGAVIAVNAAGEYAAACNGMESFSYIVGSLDYNGVSLVRVDC